MKKMVVVIASKEYTVTLDAEFASFFEEDFKRFSSDAKNIDIKTLLNAYIEKCYASYLQEKKIDTISQTIDKRLK